MILLGCLFHFIISSDKHTLSGLRGIQPERDAKVIETRVGLWVYHPHSGRWGRTWTYKYHVPWANFMFGIYHALLVCIHDFRFSIVSIYYSYTCTALCAFMHYERFLRLAPEVSWERVSGLLDSHLLFGCVGATDRDQVANSWLSNFIQSSFSLGEPPLDHGGLFFFSKLSIYFRVATHILYPDLVAPWLSHFMYCIFTLNYILRLLVDNHLFFYIHMFS